MKIIKEIYIGVRFDITEGIVFLDLEKINQLLSQGIKILEILPGKEQQCVHYLNTFVKTVLNLLYNCSKNSENINRFIDGQSPSYC